MNWTAIVARSPSISITRCPSKRGNLRYRMSDYDERLRPMLTKTQTAPADILATVGRLRSLMQWLRRHVMPMVAGPLVLILAVAWGGFYWASARFVVSTDDAYVQAHSTIVASRVSGYISAVLVDDDQPVRAGQVLARIDDRDFRAALDQVRAEVEGAQAEVADLHAQLAQQDTQIAGARASVAASEAALDLASLNRVRYRKMAGMRFCPPPPSQEAGAPTAGRHPPISGERARPAHSAGQRQGP